MKETILIDRNIFYKFHRMVVFATTIILLSAAILLPPVNAGETIMLSGLSEPVHDVMLSFEVDGKISQIFLREGEEVKKGQPIILLNNLLENLEVKRNWLIWESKVEVNSAAEREKMLKSLFDSTLELYTTTGSVSKDEVEKLELEYRLAAAEHERLKVAENREQIEYDITRAKRDKRILLSPIDGVISDLFLDEGESCESRQPVVRIVNTSQCLLVCNVEAALGVDLKKGQKVDISIQLGSGKINTKAIIIFISPIVDPASGLFQVKAAFKNTNRKIKPGVEGFMILSRSK